MLSVKKLGAKWDLTDETICIYLRQGRVNGLKTGKSWRIKNKEVNRCERLMATGRF